MSRNTKQSSQLKLALIMVAVLALIWLVQPTVSEWLGKEKSTPALPKTQSSSSLPESTPNVSPTVPALMPGVDPFKAHLEKQGASPVPLANPTRNPPNNVSGTNPPGADPFKAFLEQQKQQEKDAGVSPFKK
jgi:hypothetical protein